MAAEITEREAIARMIEGLRQAEASSRIIAHYRRDERWILVASTLGQIIDKVSTMAVQKMGVLGS